MMTSRQFAHRFLEMAQGDTFEALIHAKDALRQARNEMAVAETLDAYDAAENLKSRLEYAMEYLTTQE